MFNFQTVEGSLDFLSQLMGWGALGEEPRAWAATLPSELHPSPLLPRLGLTLGATQCDLCLNSVWMLMGNAGQGGHVNCSKSSFLSLLPRLIPDSWAAVSPSSVSQVDEMAVVLLCLLAK